MVVGIKESLKLKSKSVLLLPLGLLVIAMLNYMFPSDIGVLKMETITIAFLTLAVYILYPTTVYFAALVRARKMLGYSPRPGDLNDG